MRIDRRIFFDAVRPSLFGGALSRQQVAGCEVILDRAMGRNGGFFDPRMLAYMLATVHHETAATFEPVRETRARTDEEAVARLERAFRAGRLPTVSKPYWRRDAEGRSYYGRGFVQLTHRDNYERMGRVVGLDLVAEPDLAMKPDVAASILICGMQEGLFTGARLLDFFSGQKADWIGARKIINGRDRAKLIAGLAIRYDAAIRIALTH